MFHLLWPPQPGRPLDYRPGKPPPPPSPSSRICIFLDFKISKFLENHRQPRIEQLIWASCRRGLIWVRLILKSWPLVRIFLLTLHCSTSALITNSGVYGSMHCTLHKCTNSAAAEVLWWPTGLVTSVHHCNWAPFQHRWWWEKLSINTRLHVKLLRNAPQIDGTQDYEML